MTSSVFGHFRSNLGLSLNCWVTAEMLRHILMAQNIFNGYQEREKNKKAHLFCFILYVQICPKWAFLSHAESLLRCWDTFWWLKIFSMTTRNMRKIENRICFGLFYVYKYTLNWPFFHMLSHCWDSETYFGGTKYFQWPPGTWEKSKTASFRLHSMWINMP